MAMASKHYRVVQIVDIESATSPEEAARQAYAMMSGVHDVLPLLRVTEVDEHGEIIHETTKLVDLEDEGIPRDLTSAKVSLVASRTGCDHS